MPPADERLELRSRDSTVDHELGTGNPCRFVGCKVENTPCDIFRGPGPTKRMDRGKGVVELVTVASVVPEVLNHRRPCVARMNRIDPNVVARLSRMEGSRLREHANRSLGRVIRRQVVNADQTCNRGDVDDRATLGILIFHHLDRFPWCRETQPRY